MDSKKKQHFAIEGMSCAACKARVERAVQPLNGVEHISVNLVNNTMNVEFDSAVLKIEDICSAVEKAGYKAIPLTQNNGSDFLRSSNQSASKLSGEKVAVLSEEQLLKQQVKALQAQRVKLWFSSLLCIVLLVVAMGPMLGLTMGFEHNLDLYIYAQVVLCLLVIFLNSAYFIRGFKALVQFAPNMDSLIAVGATSSFAFSCYTLSALPSEISLGYLHHNAPLYFESVATILTLVSVGKYLEARAKGKVVSAVSQLYQLAPQTVTVRRSTLSADGSSRLYYEEKINLAEVKVGDEIIVRSGDRIGVDGSVLEGKGYADESAITGESNLVKKVVGSPITSATFLRHGYIIYRVEKVGTDTTLAQIIELINNANSQRAPIARIADIVAYYFVPAVLLIALVTAIVWLQLGASPAQALTFAVSVLVVSCPCALGLATPTAIMVGTERAASLGILFKTPESLERLNKVDFVIFDKTGTLTEGKMQVLHVDIDKSTNLQECRTAILAMEKRSDHPIAHALVAYFEGDDIAFEQKQFAQIDSKGSPTIYSLKPRVLGQEQVGSANLCKTIAGRTVVHTKCHCQRDRYAEAVALSMEALAKSRVACKRNCGCDELGQIDANICMLHDEEVHHEIGISACCSKINDEGHNITDFYSYEGSGLEIRIDGHRYFLGSSTFISKNLFKLRLPKSELLHYEKQGLVTVHLFDEERHLATIALGDKLKSSAKDVVNQLHNLGTRALIVSGDSLNVVTHVAQEVGISTFKSNCLPQDKTNFIDSLQHRGHIIAMVGDGINDAPSLTLADVGVSVSGATDIANASADVVLMRQNMTNLVSAIIISRLTIRNIKENLFWAFIYNVICIPLAAGLLYEPLGLSLNPMIAALLMSLSSVCVVSNALRLKRTKLSYVDAQGNMHEVIANEAAELDKAELDELKDYPELNRPKTQGSSVNASIDASAAASLSKSHQSVKENTLESTSKDMHDESAINEQADSSTNSTVIADHEDNGQKENLTMKKKVMIEGMMCDHCVRSVTKVLSALAGVSDVNVNLEQKCAVFNADESVTDEAIKHCIEEEGFNVVSISSLES